MCFFTICTNTIAPLASVNCDNDDDRYDIVGCGAAGQPATGVWTSQISYEAVASVVRELYVFEALMCFYTICTKYNAPMPSNNSDSDDDRYDIVGCGAAGQPATGRERKK